jgi:hypothetical protein
MREDDGMQVAPRAAAPASRATPAAETVPSWLTTPVLLAVVWVTATGAAGVVLLWHSAYHPALCGLAGTAAAAAAWRVRPRPAAGARPAVLPAVAALAVAGGLLASSAAFRSEHLLVDRDPGVYVDSGRSIARTHELRPQVDRGPFDHEDLTFRSTGFAESRGRVVPLFLHHLPVLLAVGWSIGGDTGMLLVPAVLGALGLLGVYLAGSALVGPRAALLPLLLLTLAPLQSWFSRDAYSELGVQLAVWTGAWLLIDALRARAPARALLAGALIGSTLLTRVDALVVVVALPLVAASEHVRTTRTGDRRGRTTVWAFALGFAAAIAASAWAVEALSRGYRRALGDDYDRLRLALVATTIAGLVGIVAARAAPGVAAALARKRPVAVGTAAAFGGAAVWALAVRPALSDAPYVPAGRIPRGELRQAVVRDEWAHSLQWFAWYLGLLTVVLAVGGLAAVTLRALRGDRAAKVVAAIVVPVTVFYVARPSITPDQLWAMRRYVPVALPGVAVGAAYAVQRVARLRWRDRPAGIAAAVVLVAVMLGAAVRAGAPIAQGRAQDGALGAIRGVCAAIGDDGAAIVVEGESLAQELPQTVRGFCGVPTAATRAPARVPFAEIAQRWAGSGGRLFVVVAEPDVVRGLVPDAVERAHVHISDRYAPLRIRGERPTRYGPRPKDLYVLEIPTAGPAAGGRASPSRQAGTGEGPIGRRVD